MSEYCRNVLAEYGSLKGLRLTGEPKIGLQLVHRRPERSTSFNSERLCSFDTDGRRWRRGRVHRKCDWRLIELNAVVTRRIVVACLTVRDGCHEIQGTCDWGRRHGRAWIWLNRCNLGLRCGCGIAIIRERSPAPKAWAAHCWEHAHNVATKVGGLRQELIRIVREIDCERRLRRNSLMMNW